MVWYWQIIITLSLIIVGRIYMKSSLKKCTSKKRMDGKTVIITGANTGIGKETALDLARRGARVILACRNVKLANQAQKDIIERTGNSNVIVHHLDLCSLKSVHAFCDNIINTEPRLDVLINNAGVAGADHKLTEDGFYIMMQANHFGPFLLTNLLLDLLKKSAPSRIVNVSSVMHICAKFNPNKINTTSRFEWINYGNAKLCGILMTRELARRLRGTNVTVNALHPGAVRTDVFRNLIWITRQIFAFWGWLFYLTPVEGCQTSVYLAVADEVENVSGKYFANCEPATCFGTADNDKELPAKTWAETERLLNIKT